MLIDFSYLWKKYNIKSSGVLHIGASTGQEISHYYKNTIDRSVWIEAIPEVYKRLVENIATYPEAQAINACISDVDDQEVIFNIASNDGQSSSFLEFGTHAKVHPDVKFVDKIKMKTQRVDSIFPDLKDYTFVNIDLQGAELLALKGMGTLINDVKFLYLEINKNELYKGCALVGEIDDYLINFGFHRAESHWAGNTGWGDAFYTR